MGFAVADRLRLPLDAIVVRKLGVPWQPEVAFGAITTQTRVMDQQMIAQLGIPADDIEEIVAREQAEIERREEFYRCGKPAPDVQNRTVVLVDDGLATGSTMLAAIRDVRRLKPAKLIVAVPVGPAEACDRVRKEADEVVCLATPYLFFSVGEWYREFPQVTDGEVQHLLTESRLQLQKHFGSTNLTTATTG